MINKTKELDESEKNKLIKYSVTPLFVGCESKNRPNFIQLFSNEKKFPLLEKVSEGL